MKGSFSGKANATAERQPGNQRTAAAFWKAAAPLTLLASSLLTLCNLVGGASLTDRAQRELLASDPNRF